MHHKSTVNIIGAGIGGLSTAAYLARNGHQVKVFEALNQVGGFVHSFRRQRKDYLFEASTHQIGGYEDIGYLDRVFELLGIDDVSMVRSSCAYETFYADESGRLAERYFLPGDVNGVIDALAARFPDERERLERYFAEIELISRDIMRIKRIQREKVTLDVLVDAITALLLKNGRPGGLVRKLGIRSYRHLVRNANRTYADLLEGFDEPLRSILGQYWLYTGTPPSMAPALLAAIITYVFIWGGAHRVTGGTSRLTEGLARQVTENGGQILCRRPIEKIVVEQGKARGVVTADGVWYPADCTVSNISSQRTFLGLVGARKLPARFAKKIRRQRLSRSAFQTFLGLRLRLEERGFESDTMFMNYEQDLEAAWQRSSRGPTARTPMVVTNYSLEDDAYAPKGCSTLALCEFDTYERWRNLSKAEYARQKAETEALLLDKLERMTGIPVRENIDVVFSGTPLTFQRYSSGMRAEIYGPEATNDQCFMNRPGPETPIENLFLVGAYSQPAHGFSAIMDAAVCLGRTITRSVAPQKVTSLPTLRVPAVGAQPAEAG